MLVAAFSSAMAQETIYLKNGSIIKGNITEFRPAQSLTVETTDGSSFVCNINEIEKITRDASLYKSTQNKSERDDSETSFSLNKGYRGFVYSGFMFGDMNGIDVFTIHGYQLHRKIFVGGGVGLRYADDIGDDTHIAAPVFGDFRFDMLNGRTSPYIEVRAGVSLAIKGYNGFYGSFMTGCRFKRFQVEMGLETIPGQDSYSTYSNEYNEKYDAVNFVINVGCAF